MENKQPHHPKVSVIIPVYNTAPYLEEALRSVMNQTLRDLQIICINDGSTDGSDEILHRLAQEDARIEVYEQQNQGPSAARNLALSHCLGEYIYFFDSDDIIVQHALETCYARCQQQELDFVFFDAEKFCTEGLANPVWNYGRTQHYQEDIVYDGKHLFTDMLNRYAYSAVVWLLFIKRAVITRLNLSFYPGIIHEDEQFTPRLYLQCQRIGCIHATLVRHRVRRGSIMNQQYSSLNVNCYLTVADELKRFASHSQDAEIRQIIGYYLHYTLDKVFNTATKLPYKEKIGCLQKLIIKRYVKYLRLRTLAKFILKHP